MFQLPMHIIVGFSKPRNLMLGLDLVGKIEAVGNPAKRFKVGNPVFAYAGKVIVFLASESAVL